MTITYTTRIEVIQKLLSRKKMKMISEYIKIMTRLGLELKKRTQWLHKQRNESYEFNSDTFKLIFT
jgi:hypothetical protein